MRLDPALAACRVAVRRCVADLAPGVRVLIACSGGADSLGLAAAALWELPRASLLPGLISVDHGLQGGSAARAATVTEWGASQGADPAEVLRVSVGADGGPEAAARSARYSALAAAAQRYGAPAVLLGHTADDQAETVLLGLARGSGARSLSGMAARRGIYRRPLLGLRREVPRAACAALGLAVWDDPHNADPAYARARVRSGALPALETALGPGVPEALARSAAQLRDDADALDDWARRAWQSVLRECGLDVAALAGLPVAIRRRVLLLAVLEAGVPPGRLAASHLAALDTLVTDWHGQGPVALPGRVRGLRAYGVLRFPTAEEG